MKNFKTYFCYLFMIAAVLMISCSDDEDSGSEPFAVQSTSPADGATDVDISTNITITFNKEFDASLLSSGFDPIILTDDRGFIVDASISGSGSQITINPSNDLDYASQYRVSLDTSVGTESGETLDEIVSFSFTTAEAPFPQVISVDPANGATDVPIDVQIEIEFSKNIDISTIRTGTLILSGGFSSNRAWRIVLTGSSAVLTPENPLESNTEYLLRLTTDVADLDGNNLQSEFSTRFTTENTPFDITSSSVTDGDEDVRIDDDITIEFSADIASINSTGPIFLTHVATGDKVSATVSRVGNVVTLSPNEPLREYGTEYELSILESLFDVDGNQKGSTTIISFTTEAFSYNYFYEIRNLGSGNSGFLEVNPNTEAIFLGFLSFSDTRQWRFSNADNSNNDRDVISSKALGNTKFIESGAPDDGNRINMSPLPSGGGFFGGQRWEINLLNSADRTFTFEQPGEILDSDLDVKSNTNITDSKTWSFSRTGPI